MDSFLLLGQIPGTNYQIDFQTWMNVAGVLAAIIIVSMIIRRYHLISHAIIMLTVPRTLKIATVENRTRLNASQLHQRAQ